MWTLIYDICIGEREFYSIIGAGKRCGKKKFLLTSCHTQKFLISKLKVKNNTEIPRKKRGYFHDLEFAYIKIKLCIIKNSMKKVKRQATLEMHITNNGLVFRT